MLTAFAFISVLTVYTWLIAFSYHTELRAESQSRVMPIFVTQMETIPAYNSHPGPVTPQDVMKALYGQQQGPVTPHDAPLIPSGNEYMHDPVNRSC